MGDYGFYMMLFVFVLGVCLWMFLIVNFLEKYHFKKRNISSLVSVFFGLSLYVAIFTKLNKYYVVTWFVFPFLILLIRFMLSHMHSKTSKMKAEKNTSGKTGNQRDVNGYEERSLLSEIENIFYQALYKELNGYNARIFTKVRLEDLVKARADDFAKLQQLRGSIKSRHIDFVICNSKMEVIAGIEVDDESHKNENAKEIDDFKNNIFRKINKELYRVVKMDKLPEAAKMIKNSLIERKLIEKENEE